MAVEGNNLTKVGDFLDHLYETECEQSAGDCLIKYLGGHGIHAINIWYGDSEGGRVISTCHDDWWDFMWTNQLATSTHIFQQSQKSMNPLFWGGDITPNDPLANQPGKEGALVALETFQARSAVTFPIHGLSVEYNGGVDCATDLQESEFMGYFNEHMELVQTTATIAHLKIQNFLSRLEPATRPRLSPREEECIKWLASGLRTQQIADKLNIGEVTVNLYIQNARKKLGAKTRPQLVAKAILEHNLRL